MSYGAKEIYEYIYNDLTKINNITTVSHLEKHNRHVLLIGEIHSKENQSDQYKEVSKFINKLVEYNNIEIDLLLEECVSNEENNLTFGMVEKYCKNNQNINVIRCDERPNVPLIVCLSRKELYEIEEVLDNMIRLLDIFTKNQDAFVKYILVLSIMQKYPLSNNHISLIRNIHFKNLKIYKDKFKNIFQEAFREIMNEDNKQKMGTHMDEFLVISQLFFSIILDWVMLYYLQRDTNKLKICYAGDIHIQNLKSCLLEMGYAEKYSN